MSSVTDDLMTQTGISALPVCSHLLRFALGTAAVLLTAQTVLVCIVAHQSLWRTSWVLASVFIRKAVLNWPAVFDLAALTAALTAPYPIALTAALILCPLVGRLKLRHAILLGTVVGVVFFFVDLYGLVSFFPWLVLERSWMALLSHLIFGGITAYGLKRIEG